MKPNVNPRFNLNMEEYTATANQMVVIGVEELMTLVKEQVVSALQSMKEERQERYLTRSEAAQTLNVDVSTLWRWAKNGILVPVKMGKKTYYRESDVKKAMMKGGIK